LFRLRLSLSPSFHLNGFASCIDSLIAFAVQSGVEELGIKFKFSRRYFHIDDSSQAFFSAKTLTL